MVMNQPTYRIEKITPELARMWLDHHNNHNRPVFPRALNSIIESFRRGYVNTGETIVFDEDGELQDGQHRLMAIVTLGITVDMIVVRGAPRDGRKHRVIVAKRSLADLIYADAKSRNRPLSSELAKNVCGPLALMDLVLTNWDSEATIFTTKARLDPDAAVHFFRVYEHHLVNSCLSAKRIVALDRSLVPPRSLMTFLAIASHNSVGCDLFDRAERFMKAVVEGTVSDGSAGHVLRRRLLILREGKRGQVNGTRDALFYIGLMLKAWNADVLGTPIQILRIASSEPMPTFVSDVQA